MRRSFNITRPAAKALVTTAMALLGLAGPAAAESTATSAMTATVTVGPRADAVPPRKPPPGLPTNAPVDLAALEARARGGDTAAQLEMAERLAAGEGTGKPDLARALAWYSRAAEGGEADASWALADLYRNGLDVPVDLGKALSWYSRAAEQGHAEAMYDLGLLHVEGVIVERDVAIAAQWFEQAADAGIARAVFMLGILYEQGVDGAPDLDAARAWYAQAADAGDATAQAALERLASGRSNVAVAAPPEGSLSAASVQTAAVSPPPNPPRQAAQGSAARQARAVPVDRQGVKEIQTRLTAAGFRTGRPDGHLGKRTAAAIRAYQKANSLPVDGRATQALLQHLRGTPVKS